MKKKILLLLIMIFPFFIDAEEFNFDWKTDIIPTVNTENEASILGVMSDGSSVMIFNNRTEEVLGVKKDDKKETSLVKYDANGDIEWKKISGKEMLSTFYDAAVTPKDEIVTVGVADYYDEFIDEGYRTGAMISKYDIDGNLIWQKGWGVTMNMPNQNYINESKFTKVMVTKENEYIAIGNNECIATPQSFDDRVDKTCRETHIIVKYDTNGNIIWQTSWTQDNLNGTIRRAKMLDDGSFILIGELFHFNYTNHDIVIAKFDKNGTIIWKKLWGGESDESIYNTHISDDGIITLLVHTRSGEIEGRPLNYSQVILRYSSAGEMISWEETQELYTITKTENYYWIVGSEVQDENNPYPDLFLKKYDKDWNLKQTKILSNYEGTIMSGRVLLDLIPLSEDKIIAIGYKLKINTETYEYEDYKDIIIKIDSNLNIIQEKDFETTEEETYFNSQNVLKRGNFLYTLYTFEEDPESTHKKTIIRKYSIIYDVTLKETTNGKVEISKKISEGIIDAKPSEGFAVDKIIIKDTSGNEIKPVLQTNGTYSFELYDDVTVEVLFKESIENPKTGILDVMTILIIGFLMSITGFFIVKNYSERLEV